MMNTLAELEPLHSRSSCVCWLISISRACMCMRSIVHNDVAINFVINSIVSLFSQIGVRRLDRLVFAG